jgi:peptidoglycan/xylan/chitin deacetylase (PgdA/CDA1 family)
VNVANPVNKKFLILSCDSEAVPIFAPNKHVDRLIWGNFPEAPYEAGIGKIMDIADEFGIKIVFFHDVLEQHSYGEETGRAARYIVSRGHDLQLHMHAEFLPEEFWARFGRQAPTWSMNFYNAEAASHLMEHGVELFQKMVGFKPLAYRAGAFRYNAPILQALVKCGIPLSFQYYPASALKSSFPYGFDAGILPVFKWSNGVVEVPLTMYEYPHPRQHPFRYCALDLNQMPGGVQQAHGMLQQFWDNGPQFNVAVMLLHSWSFLQKNELGHPVWKDDSLVKLFSDFLKGLAPDVQIITATELLTKISQKELAPAFELPIQIAGTDGIPLLPPQEKQPT